VIEKYIWHHVKKHMVLMTVSFCLLWSILVSFMGLAIQSIGLIVLGFALVCATIQMVFMFPDIVRWYYATKEDYHEFKLQFPKNNKEESP